MLMPTLHEKLDKCVTERCKIFSASEVHCSSSENSDDDDDDIDYDSDDNVNHYEENEIPKDTDGDIIDSGAYIATEAAKLFYICKVLDTNIADQFLHDDYQHHISKGDKYITIWKK